MAMISLRFGLSFILPRPQQGNNVRSSLLHQS